MTRLQGKTLHPFPSHSRIITLLLHLVFLTFLAFGPGGPAQAAEPAVRTYPVVVYGGTAGGAVAAITAARQGMQVALVEPGNHIGGMMSGGLGSTDLGDKAVIGGAALDFFRRAGAYYGTEVAWEFEPHVAEAVLRDWLEAAGVKIFFGHHIIATSLGAGQIVSLQTDDGSSFSAKVFIDASYEGDLMARAGVGYTVGRESRARYGESLAGKQADTQHPFPVPVPAFDETNQLLPLLSPTDPAPSGEGDAKLPAYNFRLCLTDRKENQVPFAMPPGYDPKGFELLRRYLSRAGGKLTLGDLLNFSRLPNGKTDTNNRGPVSTDFIGHSWEYPEATFARREEIKKEHQYYIQGFLYFLANDPSVPRALQQEARGWGLAKDEFADTGNWPHQLYVREARRMTGAYVLTQADLQRFGNKADSIGMGSFAIDSHFVQRYPSAQGVAFNEGDFEVVVGAYEIPYRSLTPKAAECGNLMVTGGVSASHVAFSSLRMEPQSMILGQAAGEAAYLAVRDNSSVQRVDTNELRSRLRGQQQILSLSDVDPLLTAPPTGSIVINGGAAVTPSATVTLTLAAQSPGHRVTKMQFSKDGGVNWFDWVDFAATKTVTLAPEGDGLRSITVVFKDAWGNVSAPCTASITVCNPVTGSIQINDGASVATASSATLTLRAASAAGTIQQMQFSKDGGDWTAKEPFAPTRKVTLTPGDKQIKSVSVRYWDSQGNASYPCTASVFLNRTPPIGSIVINGGAPTAHAAPAVLALSASSTTSTVTEMQFSKDNGLTWYPWEKFATTRSVTLVPAENGISSVSVRFRDASGESSDPYTATIALDVVPPVGSIQINGGAPTTTSSTAQLSLSAASAFSSIVGMQFSKDDGQTWVPWESFATTRKVTLTPAGPGLKTVTVRFSDALGNVSKSYPASIVLR